MNIKFNFFSFFKRRGDFNISNTLNSQIENRSLYFKNLWLQKKRNKLYQAFQKVAFFVYKKRVLLGIVVLAFLLADFLKIKAYHFVLPQKDLKISSIPVDLVSSTYQNKYSSLWENNIFHQGPIPIKLVDNKGDISNQEPVKSQLSLKLHGTIVHANPKKSVATVKNIEGDVEPYQVAELISNQAKIFKIQKRKVIFLNQNNNRLEFIVLPKDDKLTISYHSSQKPKSISKNKKRLVHRKGNRFEVNRSDINSYLDNIYDILQQALVIPHHENGEIAGYKFKTIDKESIYEDLGFQKNDIIRSVNGEVVRNPQKALQLFHNLKASSGLEILVERDGKEVTFNYKVNENTFINN